MASKSLGILAWLGGHLLTLLVLAGLAALFAWGATYQFKLPPWLRGKEAKKEEAKDEAEVTPALLGIDDEDAEKAGVEFDSSRSEPIVQTVEAPGVLGHDQTRYAHLAPRAAGSAWRVFKNTGEEVKKGDFLALISAADAGKARADFLTAYVQHEVRSLTVQRLEQAGDAVAEKQIREARLALREARVKLLNEQQQLGNLGLSLRLEDLKGLNDDQIARRIRLLGLPSLPDNNTIPANLLPLAAPFDGTVVRRDLVLGEMVDSSKTVFTVADLSRLWLMIDVRQEEVGRLAIGQPVIFRARATEQTATGVLTWISAEVDPKTRTIPARAELENTSRQLRPGTFGRAHIQVRRDEAVTVPTPALQFDGRSYRVFVRHEEKYEPRLVLPGSRHGDRTVLLNPQPLLGTSLAGQLAAPGTPWALAGPWLAGHHVLVPLAPGQRIVQRGSHVLLSEMLKSRIGGEE
jgi:cobalt-zinc-cadmium efflux system membrane fusion protein